MTGDGSPLHEQEQLAGVGPTHKEGRRGARFRGTRGGGPPLGGVPERGTRSPQEGPGRGVAEGYPAEGYVAARSQL